MSIYLLTINGKFSPSSLEETRVLHNATAGDPGNVAAAQSLGDLSHMVYVPVGNDAGNDFVIMDVWNNLEGLGMFFSNEHVQEQAGRIFAQRDPVVWAPANDIFNFNLPAPTGKTERFVGLVRGPVASREQAAAIMEAATKNGLSKGRKLGLLSHQNFFRLDAPSDAPEYLGLEVWYSLEGAFEYYATPGFEDQFQGMYTGMPMSAILQSPAGSWTEW